ncbi:TPA: hypothetical protein N0F65_006832 [Lagenidium giganteum]|uniref:Uncharacterized protein n=1 Tax=Lagenidium giganteum TaxID=4803 RepID=A0AAV2Z9N7_9STRA|nr:TPA: hypothetical protein N0F65_006832 [Lagenidium giganteum]
MNTIVINGSSASAGAIFMRVQLTIRGKHQRQRTEVIQCKLLQTKQKISRKTYVEERAKAVNESDVFLLITSGDVTEELPLPARCGIVSKKEFGRYFGPFASRAYRSFLGPPNINTASYHELRRIEGVGDATAKQIINERKKRPFSCQEDAVNRLFAKKESKNAKILHAMHCDDV